METRRPNETWKKQMEDDIRLIWLEKDTIESGKGKTTYNTTNFIEHQNRAIKARMRLQIQKIKTIAVIA